MNQTPQKESHTGAKIIGLSILIGSSLLGFILSLALDQSRPAAFAAITCLIFLYLLITLCYELTPIRSSMNWLAGYSALENRMENNDTDNS